MTDQEESAELAMFRIFAAEFPGDDPSKTLSKLKRKLKQLHIPFDQQQADRVRALHTSLRDEISKLHHSKYYRPRNREFAAPENFDSDAMVEFFSNLLPHIKSTDLERMIGFAVYLYYMR